VVASLNHRRYLVEGWHGLSMGSVPQEDEGPAHLCSQEIPTLSLLPSEDAICPPIYPLNVKARRF
jgi:hypothetical protein